jgi:protein-L-isoaspartate(D-aspartate) O-methyltransferase
MAMKNSEDGFVKERKSFVKEVIQGSGISDLRVLKAFSEIPREEFVSEQFKEQAYLDSPLPIGSGQTISQPSLVALMTELLHLKGDEKVLEVGTGSGFQAAILSQLAKEVYTIERLPNLSQRAKQVCQKLGLTNIHFEVGDGSLGLPKEAPFEAIIVTAGAKEIPQTLVKQLRIGGRLVIPSGEELSSQSLKVVTKTKTGMNVEEIERVAFVPLIGKYGWKDNLNSFI